MKNKSRIGLFGNKYHVELLMNQLNDFDENISAKICELGKRNFYSQLKDIDIYHGVGTCSSYKEYFVAKLFRKKTICHWIGTDVLDVLRYSKSRMMAKLSNMFIGIHLAGSETLVDELRTVGIKAYWIPLVPQLNVTEIPSLPPKFTVLSYIPDHRAQYYSAPIIYELAEEFPDIDFLITAGTEGNQRKLPNVTYLGWQEDMDAVYKKSTVFIRLPKHDGLSLSLLESLLYGRQVIWNNRFPHCHYARTYDEVKEALLKIMRNSTVNYEGAQYLQNELSLSSTLQKLVEIYKRL